MSKHADLFYYSDHWHLFEYCLNSKYLGTELSFEITIEVYISRYFKMAFDN